jgi:RimJ/RimL family protein N-acetyltransferase
MPLDAQAGRELLEQRLDALYRSDGDGRLVCSNEWDARPAPRFHMMMTPVGPMLRWRGDVPASLVARLERLSRGEAWDPEAREPIERDRYVELLESHAPVERVWSGPVYVWARDVAPSRAPVTISAENSRLLERRFPDWVADIPHRHPFVAAIENREAVALCASVRISKAVHCAGVETHPDHRRRGHAADAVAGWARAVRIAGATPFYSTSWDNLASQAVARRLGFTLAAMDFHVT